MQAGYEAQLKSIVLLKNKSHVLPLQKGITVYIPKRFTAASKDFFGNITPEKWENAVNPDLVKKYFNVSTENPSKRMLLWYLSAIRMAARDTTRKIVAKQGNGYVPISLQYGPYTAKNARAQVMASGDPAEPRSK